MPRLWLVLRVVVLDGHLSRSPLLDPPKSALRAAVPHYVHQDHLEGGGLLENREFDIATNRGNRYGSLGEINPGENTVAGIEPNREVDVL